MPLVQFHLLLAARTLVARILFEVVLNAKCAEFGLFTHFAFLWIVQKTLADEALENLLNFPVFIYGLVNHFL